MLAPQPGRTVNQPRPLKILSKAALRAAWKTSRDATNKPGRPGTDNETAQQFSTRLDANLDYVVRRLRDGQYGFSRLRAVFIPKEDAEKERVICIPTVRDRLVQRAMIEYLTSRRIFPIDNISSFGFMRGRGPQHAVARALELRTKYDWCLKTDIQSFFDRIPRSYLKTKVTRALGGNSLEFLVHKIIDCEVKTTSENRVKLQRQGIVAGRGIRQGMPLSPILANLALSDFDRAVEHRRIGMVRYADDLALFFRTKEEAQEGRHYIKLLLATFELSIPEIEHGSKTKIVSRSDPLEFLGREIVFLGSSGAFAARVGAKQVEKIKTRLKKDFSFAARSSKGGNLQDTIVDLSRSMAAYLGIYKDASNYPQFKVELRDVGRSIVAAIFQDLFGEESLCALSAQEKKFLGIGMVDALEADPELDV